MKVNKKDLKNSRVQLTVEVPAADMPKYKQAALAEISQNVKVPGFRAGHVPEEKIVEQVGETTIQQEAERKAITSSYTKAIQEAGVMPVSQPKVEVTKAEPLTFTIEFDVYPEVKLGKYKDVKVSVKETKVGKKEIDEVMKQLQEQVKDFKEVSRKAKDGDAVEMDFEGFDKDGNPVPNTKGEKYTLVLGSKQFIPGFEEKLEGAKAGDETEFPITFPKDYHAAEMAGVEFTFKVKVHTVKESVMPEVNEEFVEKITGKKDSVKSLEDEIKKNLELKNYKEDRAKAEEELLKKLAKGAKMDVPASMIEEETAFLLDNVKMGGLQQGMPWEKYLEAMQKTEEEVKKELEGEAGERVKNRLIIQEIIKADEVTVDEVDIEARSAHALSHLKPEDQTKQAADYKAGGKQYEQMRNMMMVEAVFNSYLGKPKRDEHEDCGHDHH